MNWSRETLNADFSHVKCCLPGINKRVFCIVTGDEKWIHYDNPKKRKSWGPSGHASTSTAKPNIHGKKLMLYLVESAWCRVLWVAQTERDHYWDSLPNTIDEFKEKRAHYYSRHDKIILLHDNARPHVATPVKTYLETLKWEVLPHPPYSLDIAPSDFHLFRWRMVCLSCTSHHMKILKIVSMIG